MTDIKDIKCIAYDFDGVMTDNRVTVDENGKESVTCSRGDGYGVGGIRKLGIRQVIISTEVNPVVARRAEKLKLEVIHGVEDKGAIIKEFAAKNNLKLEEILFMGNDLNDLPALNLVGIKAAPCDAEKEILAIADWVSERKGGYGAVRDLFRYISENR